MDDLEFFLEDYEEFNEGGNWRVIDGEEDFENVFPDVTLPNIQNPFIMN